MTYLLIRHCVADFANWKAAYDAHASARAAAGLKDKDLFARANWICSHVPCSDRLPLRPTFRPALARQIAPY